MAIWLCFIVKCMLAIRRQSIAKLSLAILATSYRLNRNNRVSSIYWTSGSKLCFLTCFSYFSCYFRILVFLLNCYLLISSRLSWLHGNPISCPISPTLGTLSWYVVHAPPRFWHRMCGFLKARCSWESGWSRLPTGEFSSFYLLPKVSGVNAHWTNANHTFLTQKNPQTDTFSHDISPAKLHSTAWVWNPQGIFKLVNRIDCQVPHALLKAIVGAFLATNSFAAGSSMYPCHMACVSMSVPRDVISLSDCHPQWLRSAVDVMRDSQDRLLSIPFLHSSGFSGA
jgi:hypothetical protein